jgi:hypothetical protein
MPTVSPEYLEELKTILENSLHPERLDSHPWAASPIMQDAQADAKSPGQRLVFAVSQLFTQMRPSAPPKRGKRLDTRWGEFGILAAQYFAPLQFGTPTPASLRDAWGRIDQGILYFVYGKPADALTDEEKAPYRLVGDEPEVAPVSTLSDWHRKGLLRLAEVIQARESFLSKSVTSASGEDEDGQASADARKQKSRRTRKILWLVILLLVLLLAGLLTFGGLKARRAYELALVLRQDAGDVQSLMTKNGSRLEKVREAGPLLVTLRQDFDALKAEVEPYLWIGPWLDWVPTYGGELASARELMTLADSLLETADASYRAVLPLVEENERSGLDLPRLTDALLLAQPRLLEARQALEGATAARARLDPETLSPEVRDLIVNDVDRLLPLLENGLALGLEFPRLLGATDEGPKTYLLLVENEDELRPTGGFITAAGTLLLQDGEIGNLDFSNSGNAEDWTKPYPTAPWQLRKYMNSPVLIFRDANWFTNFPTAAQYAEYLYSLSSNHSVDGVIAFDQQMLIELLDVTGPLRVEGAEHLVDAGNVVSYMRASKTPTPEQAASPEWNNKLFLNQLTRALMGKIFSGDVELEQLATFFLRALDEHHILLQVDNPIATSVLAHYHWDGAVRPSGGDFLMVVDTNVGFNKTNAVVSSSLAYAVDLTRPNSFKSTLTVSHTNGSVGIDSCNHWGKVRVEGEKYYPIQDCYWNYMRVYTNKGAFLREATPQSIPAEWMIGQESPPAQVDLLNEEIAGVQGFGTIQVVPASDSLTTDFQFLLPPDVLQAWTNNQWMYRLKVQKQPGTRAVPITIRIQLPEGATVIQAPPGATVEGTLVLFQTDLRLDRQIEVLYQFP